MKKKSFWKIMIMLQGNQEDVYFGIKIFFERPHIIEI